MPIGQNQSVGADDILGVSVPVDGESCGDEVGSSVDRDTLGEAVVVAVGATVSTVGLGGSSSALGAIVFGKPVTPAVEGAPEFSPIGDSVVPILGLLELTALG